MIIGIIHVFKCDGVGCEAFESVDMNASLEEFETRWFIGMDKHFCKRCRFSLPNQAEVARQENAMRDMGERVAAGVRSAVESETWPCCGMSKEVKHAA